MKTYNLKFKKTNIFTLLYKTNIRENMNINICTVLVKRVKQWYYII